MSSMISDWENTTTLDGTLYIVAIQQSILYATFLRRILEGRMNGLRVQRLTLVSTNREQY